MQFPVFGTPLEIPWSLSLWTGHGCRTSMKSAGSSARTSTSLAFTGPQHTIHFASVVCMACLKDVWTVLPVS
eukprot:85498-Amphidinium_carterae.1